MAAQGQDAVEAIALKPAGRRLTQSVWLIQQTLSAGKPAKSGLLATLSATLPYSLLPSAAATSPPAICARSWWP